MWRKVKGLWDRVAPEWAKSSAAALVMARAHVSFVSMMSNNILGHQVRGGPLRKLHDVGTSGCPLSRIIECRRVRKHVFQRRPLCSYLLLLLEPSSPGQGIATSSRKAMTEHLRLQYPLLHLGCWEKTCVLPKPRALGPRTVTSVTAVKQQCSPVPYPGAEWLTVWQPPGIPGQDCRDIVLKLARTYLMRSLSY